MYMCFADSAMIMHAVYRRAQKFLHRDRLSSPCLKRLRHNDIIRELQYISRAAKQSRSERKVGANRVYKVQYMQYVLKMSMDWSTFITGRQKHRESVLYQDIFLSAPRISSYRSID